MLVSLLALYLFVANAEPITAFFSNRNTKGFTFIYAFAVSKLASECSRYSLQHFDSITYFESQLMV